ncbi:MAG: hypothetical protein SGBAC_006887, partial [Bacillariaceae sp.]
VIKDEEEMSQSTVVAIIAFCGAVTVASLVAAIIMGNRLADTAVATPAASGSQPNIVINTGSGATTTGTTTTGSSSAASAAMENLFARPPRAGPNECEGKKVQIDNVDCLIDALENVLPQAGGNVTMGFKGEMVVGHEPIKTPYFQNDMCPVNVHWHLGAEHLSVGEFDEMGSGPHTKPGDLRRKLAGDEDVRGGFRCRHYDENDEKFTKEFDWQHCVGMEVGETYEVHWPHSAAGACGTINQYQTPFYDGVLCRIGVLGDLSRLPQQVGVQGQVFTIVNDEEYFYPDMMRGMIVDGEMGSEITKYTGSTTGTSRDNEICSAYSPITWQVDRKCHMISASSFDKMCADMKAQRDDMSDDLYAHGSRELVDSKFTANNQHNRALRAN